MYDTPRKKLWQKIKFFTNSIFFVTCLLIFANLTKFVPKITAFLVNFRNYFKFFSESKPEI
jgi:hypothetical protein